MSTTTSRPATTAKSIYNNFAPRIGFSYDLNADQRTVFFGGYGRYYDRALFRNARRRRCSPNITHREIALLAERTSAQWRSRRSISNRPFLTPAGFAALSHILAATDFPGTASFGWSRTTCRRPTPISSASVSGSGSGFSEHR